MKENPEDGLPDEREHESEAHTENQPTQDYDVGYQKPPKATQFQIGQSGNPNGRPKGTKNFKTDLQEELLEPIRVTEGGKPVVMSKQRGIVKRTVELALKGNMQATNLLTRLIAVYLVVEEQEENPVPLSHEDRAILERFLGARGPRERESSTQ